MRVKSWLESILNNNRILPNRANRRRNQKVVATHQSYETLEDRRLLANGADVGLLEWTDSGEINTLEIASPLYAPLYSPGLDQSEWSPVKNSGEGGPEGPFPNEETFRLHSKPGSNFTLLLDFDGHITEGTRWNRVVDSNMPTIVHPAWDFDGTPGTFSQLELDMIQQIWQRVAEDYAPFDVNVTTEDPGTEALRKDGSGTDTQWGTRAVMTTDYGACSDPCGGVAYPSTFNTNTDEPNLVFNNSLDSISETISHETGHQTGLVHDGLTAPPDQEYYPGHGVAGATSWGTIMGGPFNQEITQWDQGEYYNANEQQDDLLIITTTNGFGYRIDDFGNTIGTAGNMNVSGSTFVSAFGIIEQNTDVDYLRFEHGGGNVSFNLTPHSDRPNLNIWAGIYDSGGNLLHDGDTFVSTDVSKPILDASTIVSNLIITDTGDIADLSVTLDISHNRQQDLDVFLIGPDGTRVELFSDVSGSGADFANTTFDDEGTIDITSGSGSFTGVFRPTGSLAEFDGKNIDGTWQLEITDDSSGIAGTLNSWSLSINRTSASFTNVNLPAGTYYLKVDGVGSDGVYNPATDAVEDPTTNEPWKQPTPTGYSNYGSLGQYAISGTIASPSSNEFSVSTLSSNKAEGNNGTTDFTFTVTRSGNTAVAANVDFHVVSTRQTLPGQNVAFTVDGSDFVGGGLPSGQVSFLAGETTKTVTITVNGDTDNERDEEFAVILENPESGWSIADSRAVGTILGDESHANVMNGVQFRWRQQNLESTFGNFAIDNVSITNTSFADDFDPGIDSSQWASIVGGVANTVFDGSDGNSLFFNGTSARTATTKVLEVQAGDQLSFDLIYGDGPNGGNATILGENVVLEYTIDLGQTWQLIKTYTQEYYKTFTTFTATVPDDSIVAPVVMAEGTGSSTNFEFEVFRRDNLDKAISVNWLVSGSGANPANALDFVGGEMPFGTVIFSAGEESKTINILVAGDSIGEMDEMFTLDLNSSTGGPLGISSRTATIQNDDGAVDDNYEENDTAASAVNPLGNGGSWASTPLSSIDGLGIANDDDWYQIEVTQDFRQIVIDAMFAHASGDINLEFYNSDGTQLLASSTSASDNEHIDFVVPTSGLHLIRVYQSSGTGNTYDLEWVGLQTTPEITVTGMGQDIVDGDSIPSTTDGTDFVSITQGGSTVSRTFIVLNDGAADMTIDSVTVPNGFAITEFLDSTITPGSSDEFTVELENSVVGTFDGEIIIVNNDSGENPFNFAIIGVVAPPTQDTLVTLESGILKITDVDNGGDSDDNLTVSHAGGFYTISDSSLLLNSPISGATGQGTTTLQIPDTGVTGITFDTLGGNDTITIISVKSGLGDFTVLGSIGDDTVNLNADITFATNADLLVDLTSGAAVGDLDKINVGTNANLLLSGAGAATLQVSRNISLMPGSSITTVDGSLTLSANQQATPTVDTFAGVNVNNGIIEATGTGIVTVSGRGGSVGSGQYGVRVTSGGEIIGGSSGNLAVTGIGGAGDGGNNSAGIRVDVGSTITSNGADLSVVGTGGGIGGFGHWGIGLFSGSQIFATGSASATLVGTGGSADRYNLAGVRVSGTGTRIGTVDGSLSVTGTGLGFGDDTPGIWGDDSAEISATGSGTVTLDGTGGDSGTGTGNAGVRMESSGTVSSNTGSIIITATAGAGSAAFQMNTGTPNLTTSNASITVIADSMAFDGSSVITAGSNLAVWLQQETNGTEIDLGGADILGSTLGLTEAELDTITAGIINIGDANSGDLTISAPITPSPSNWFNLITGGDLIPLASGTDVNIGTALLGFGSGSDLNIVIDGVTPDTQYRQLNVAGRVNLDEVNLVISGSHTPVGGEQFIVVNNDGTEPIVSTFKDLDEGAVITNFMGSGLDATISYLGIDASSGNDAVLTVSTTSLSLTVAAASIWEDAGAGATTATVTRVGNLTNELVVNLSSNDPSEATVQTTVTIPAGQATSPAFDIDAVDDAIVDGTQTVTITASVTGYSNGTDTVDVLDNEPTDDNYEENDTAATASSPAGNNVNWEQTPLSSIDGLGIANDDDWYVINVTQDFQRIVIDATFAHAGGDINLQLYNSDGTQLLAGSTSTTDDEHIDFVVPTAGLHLIRVFPSSGTDNTYDLEWDDTKVSLSVDIAAASIQEDAGAGATTATVTRIGDLTNPLVVNLSSNDPSEATVQTTVTIPAGQATSPAFDIDAVDDAILDGTQTVTIIASVAGYDDGTDMVDVLDDDDDSDDQMSEATWIEEGRQYSDMTEFGEDVDMYRFEVYAGQTISIQANTPSSSFDPRLDLFDSNGNQLATDDDTNGRDPQIDFSFTEAGEYFIGVSAYQNADYDPISGTGDTPNSNFGTYDIVFRDLNDSISEAVLIDIGSGFTEFLGGVSDVDMYQVAISNLSKTYVFDTDLFGSGDTVLRLFDAAGTQLEVNDDNILGELLASTLTYTFSTVGSYYIGVSHYPNSAYNPTTGDSDSTGSIVSPSVYMLSVDTVDTVFTGDLQDGIAVDDDAVGTGYIMYSEENIHTRFTGLHQYNANHFVAVRLVGGSQWQFNTNVVWEDFRPTVNDVIVAEVDFSQDTSPVMLVGQSSLIAGIAAGYYVGDISILANSWNGQSNQGEFEVFGTSFQRNMVTTIVGGSTDYSAGNLGRGVAASDAATGTGYMMYSAESVHSRFGGLNEFNADHFIAVRFNGGNWQYNNNSETLSAAWINFNPLATDILVADIDFSADTVTSLQGTSSTINGIAAGYQSGDLVFTANQWNGGSNAGEFEITGTMFTVGGSNDGTDYSVGDLGRGVAVSDAATGTGYMMYSAESVHSRFGGLNEFNADHFIAVRFNGGNWQYNNNSETLSAAWINFNPLATDILVADIDFSADTVTSLQGTSSTINGITAGYQSGDLVFTANQWNGGSNAGEFEITGTMFTVGGSNDGTDYSVGDLGRGVAVSDAATGTGYMMYSAESVHSRFGGLLADNADHFIAVRFDGGNWQYNNNSETLSAAWINFNPLATDILVADIDFSADTVTSLQGTSSTINGITAGYQSGDLVFTANQWNGGSNAGEFEITGTMFTVGGSNDGTDYSVGDLGRGVAVSDAATGTGYMMYSAESVHSRFGGLLADNADHFIAVRFDGGNWQYNNNSETLSAAWINFNPLATDILVADIDFSADTVTSLQGTSSTINGIAAGYQSGDLVFTANQWNGGSNAGEFEITGTMFTVGGSNDGTDYSVGDLGRGVAVSDAATGTGYMMYSAESVHSRFGGLLADNADHFIAVRFDGGNWQYNNNSETLSAAWINFNPLATDILVADIDFSADTVTSLQGTSSTINGIAAGYQSGDLVFTANQWNGGSNAGEFEITGTMFTVGATGTSVGDLGWGVAVDDSATGTGFILYSATSVHSRFGGLLTDNAEHFIAVRQVGSQWQYNDNSGWIDFVSEASDVLIAQVDFSNDIATNLFGIDALIGGIAAGFVDGDLNVMADTWNGTFNDGEFGMEGTFFVHEDC